MHIWGLSSRQSKLLFVFDVCDCRAMWMEISRKLTQVLWLLPWFFKKEALIGQGQKFGKISWPITIGNGKKTCTQYRSWCASQAATVHVHCWRKYHNEGTSYLARETATRNLHHDQFMFHTLVMELNLSEKKALDSRLYTLSGFSSINQVLLVSRFVLE